MGDINEGFDFILAAELLGVDERYNNNRAVLEMGHPVFHYIPDILSSNNIGECTAIKIIQKIEPDLTDQWQVVARKIIEYLLEKICIRESFPA